MAREEIIQALKKATGFKEIDLDVPTEESHGDFASNIVLKLVSASKGTQEPRVLAEKIVEKLKKDQNLKGIVDRIEIAGPGFLNFWLSQEYLEKETARILKEKDKYGQANLIKSKQVIFEFGQPNTHKLPHIGHLFSYIYGEAMARIMESAGWRVIRANYQGDIGPHVAKCLWALNKNKPQIPVSLEEKVELLQKMYQLGSSAYEKSKESKKEIDELNKQIYLGDKEVTTLWTKTRGWSLDYYQKFEGRLNIAYDKYYFESEVGNKGKEIVEKNIPDVFIKSRGAVIFPGSKYGLHDRVFVTSQGTPTYEAKDLALQTQKLKDYPADLLVITTAREQNEYFRVIFKALGELDSKFKDKLKHIGFGLVSLKSGKLSSRKGQIIGAVQLVDKVVAAVSKLNKDKEIAEMIGLGAVKYSFLKNNPLQDIKFNLKESIATEGNSGPYLQYTFARAQSVLSKAKNKKEFDASCEGTVYKEELALMRAFSHFSGIIIDAAKTYSPNLLCNYLFDLAQKYNTFYNAHKILGSQKEKSRLALTAATGQILKVGLKILGIQAPEKM